VTDPDYCVLKFTAENGRYYSNFKSENFAIGALIGGRKGCESPE
jgi:hypothetical protein